MLCSDGLWSEVTRDEIATEAEADPTPTSSRRR